MRTITITYNDEFNEKLIEYKQTYIETEMQDSSALHRALCEIKPHKDYPYTVVFENITVRVRDFEDSLVGRKIRTYMTNTEYEVEREENGIIYFGDRWLAKRSQVGHWEIVK